MKMRMIQIVVGLACTAFFLTLALYRVPLGTVGATLASANPVWIATAIAIYTVNLMLRACRWQIILRPVAVIPYSVMARALVVGYGLNTIMPARMGELFRVEFLKRDVGLSRVWALTSVVIERLFDGLTVVLCLGIGLQLSTGAGEAAGLLIGALVAGSAIFGAILLVALCLAGPRIARACGRLSRFSAQALMVQRGLAILRTRRIAAVALLTLLIYPADMLSLWCVVKAVGLGLGFADTLVLLGAASLSTLLPSGPAFLGTLQFAYALVFEFAGAPRAIGIAAATLAQLCILLPVGVAAVAILFRGAGSVLLAALASRKSGITPVGS